MPADGGASFSARSRRRLWGGEPPPSRGRGRAPAEGGHTIEPMSTGATNSRGSDGGVSIHEAAARVGVSAGTLRRWAREGLIPQHDGTWSTGAVGHARIVARLRERGHSLEDIRQATEEGRLAFGFLNELFDSSQNHTYTAAQAARETGLEPKLVERIITALGLSPAQM